MEELRECRAALEQVEVTLTNLLRLKDTDSQKLITPYDDLIITLETAIRLTKLD